MIQNTAELRVAIRKLETLASIQRQRGYPLALMPRPEESAVLLADAAEYMRRTFDPDFPRQFLLGGGE